MKAVVLKMDGVLSYEDVPLPTPRADRPVLIRVMACGVCGSDLKRGFRGGAYAYPLIMGHELSGIVEQVPAVSEYHVGDHVTVFPLIPCLKCNQCKKGEYARCEDYDYLGSRCGGGFSEYVRVPEMNLVRMPGDVSFRQAALTEPCAVARHGVGRFDLADGGAAAVYGGGPIGNLCAQWLKTGGADPICIVDVQKSKLQTAASMGFTAINGAELDPVQEIMRITKGEGVSYCLEACGLPVTFLQALRSAATGGQVCFMGNIEGDLTISEKDFSSILRRELKIYGTWNSSFSETRNDDWRESLAAMGKKIDIDSLITHTEPLENAQTLMADMASGNEAFGKVIFIPHNEVTSP